MKPRLSKEFKNKKVLMALSGGIDSAVSAYLLLKQGYEVEAVFMKNWSSTTGLLKNECPWLEDRQTALRVAAFLKIPLHTLDFEKQYQKNVMGYFFQEYKAGRTPNPDVMCNKEIKFKLLYNWAMKKGFNFLATGHYARVQQKADSKKLTAKTYSLLPNYYSLVRSQDEFKDQTYFIYNIKTEQLPHLLFPIGGMKKPAVKKLAEKIGLPNAGRKESMGLCFVGKVRLKEFLGQKIKPKKGKIIDNTGKILGQHEGLSNYTIGQRQGIKVGGGGPFYVFKKDLATNALFVTNNPEDKRLFTQEIQLHSVNWITPPNLPFNKREEYSSSPSLHKPVLSLPNGRGLGGVLSKQLSTINYKLKPNTYKLTGRFRHQGELVQLTIQSIKKDLYQVIFKYPQKAVASGQSLVLYKGKECVGGGVIV